MLAMSTLMMPAATMTTMTNPGPIPVAQAKFAAGGGGGGGGAVAAPGVGEPNGKLAPLNHNAAGNKSGENSQMTGDNTGILAEASKEIALEVNPEETMYMIMSRDQNIIRNGCIKIADLSIEKWKNSSTLNQQLQNRIVQLVEQPTGRSQIRTQFVTLFSRYLILQDNSGVLSAFCKIEYRIFLGIKRLPRHDAGHVTSSCQDYRLMDFSDYERRQLPSVLLSLQKHDFPISFLHTTCSCKCCETLPHRFRIRYLSPIVRSSPIASLVLFSFLKPNCSSSNGSSILEYKRPFSNRGRIFAEYDIRLIVLNLLHFMALFFFGIGSNTVSVKSLGHNDRSYMVYYTIRNLS
ncbi:hypothetical protein ANN_01141 [Periplaneta americana]|uniref:Uncharacterized protein n=1 Tax=Periplaneta americana TaxID=6978 RepID=A0ABQ8TUI1_PERAM|nr:hypothetical protein ANN_01141 [Periplaneta americana]